MELSNAVKWLTIVVFRLFPICANDVTMRVNGDNSIFIPVPANQP